MTENLLRGLQVAQPSDRWVLWGPEDAAAFLWPGADHVISKSKPTDLNGQRDWFSIPSADLVIFLHQQRPLRRVPAMTLILDTAPVRYNRNRVDGWAKTRFLRRVAHVSRGVITISDFSRECIQHDLGIGPERITKLGLPVDAELASRVLARRTQSVGVDVALYIGLFLPHKNLPRLIQAFGRTEFCRAGGTLLLVGGRDRAGMLRQTLDRKERSFVTIRESCTQDELERLYATSLFLVQPSLEEGFGLPVQEALSCGLPVCSSNGGALPEVTRGFAQHFDPNSVTAMAAAIDTTAKLAVSGRHDGRSLSGAYFAQTPSIADLTSQVLTLVDRQLRCPSQE